MSGVRSLALDPGHSHTIGENFITEQPLLDPLPQDTFDPGIVLRRTFAGRFPRRTAGVLNQSPNNSHSSLAFMPL